jgi:hypothetical protein
MRARQHVMRPSVERFESRALLSGAIAALPPAAAATSAPLIRFLSLDGTIRGHYHVNDAIPDVGATYVADGSGHVHGVGHAFLTGKLHTIGFIAQGHAGGDFYLAGANGTITLQMTGVEQDQGPKGPPDVFHYTVVSGTGKYVNVADSGTATLVTIPGHAPAHPQAPEHGRFTLVLTSAPTPS